MFKFRSLRRCDAFEDTSDRATLYLHRNEIVVNGSHLLWGDDRECVEERLFGLWEIWACAADRSVRATHKIFQSAQIRKLRLVFVFETAFFNALSHTIYTWGDTPQMTEAQFTIFQFCGLVFWYRGKFVRIKTNTIRIFLLCCAFDILSEEFTLRFYKAHLRSSFDLIPRPESGNTLLPSKRNRFHFTNICSVCGDPNIIIYSTIQNWTLALVKSQFI